ncbi:MAG: glutamine--fructose-6-phosphate transaminase (isomerizing) [Clostridiales bacterium]|jgi:glucosamine--fructose-6-phosphate aminotransferase (isomerizing)|nr:glutamine--fructose-6-phosphate transaminase (isomerizing) [Clostridiales bacterium]
MCGIIGYTGAKSCLPILLEGLYALEYRGYDSAGVAAVCGERVHVIKKEGRVSELDRMLALHHLTTTCGIGHTRWATHGRPSDANAHPHLSMSGAIAVVHNGIIENFLELKQELMNKGVLFRSETDTEVIGNLIGTLYTGDIHAAVRAALPRLKGAYALAVLSVDTPDTVVLAAKDSPLIAGEGTDGMYAASDVPALIKRAKTLYRMGDGETAVLTPAAIGFFAPGGEPIQKQPLGVEWRREEAELGNHESFMKKEMGEIPLAVRRTLESARAATASEAWRAVLGGVRRALFIGCGTAYHAGLTGAAAVESLCRIPAAADTASEFRYRDPVTEPDTLAVFVSQSGETADTLAAARLAKRRGLTTLAVVNAAGSSLTAVCDYTLHTRAGPEIAVASTKAYNAQLAALYVLALALARAQNALTAEAYAALQLALDRVPAQCEAALTLDVTPAVRRWNGVHDLYFLGRGTDYHTALEGALKLKEISYAHCEAYPAGELKHGTLALIEEGTPVVAVVTQPALAEKMRGSLEEVRARGGSVLALATPALAKDLPCAEILTLPDTHPLFAPLVSVIPLQQFAYAMSRARGCDADKPRNLAKSVTVE